VKGKHRTQIDCLDTLNNIENVLSTSYKYPSPVVYFGGIDTPAVHLQHVTRHVYHSKLYDVTNTEVNDSCKITIQLISWKKNIQQQKGSTILDLINAKKQTKMSRITKDPNDCGQEIK
jgi:hypothetical protein